MYTRLAQTIRTQHSSDVEFYAVSCDAHPAFCDEIGVEATPSLYVYPQGAVKGRLIETFSAERIVQELGLPAAPASMESRRLGDEGGEEDNDPVASGDGGEEDGTEDQPEEDGDSGPSKDDTEPGETDPEDVASGDGLDQGTTDTHPLAGDEGDEDLGASDQSINEELPAIINKANQDENDPEEAVPGDAKTPLDEDDNSDRDADNSGKDDDNDGNSGKEDGDDNRSGDDDNRSKSVEAPPGFNTKGGQRFQFQRRHDAGFIKARNQPKSFDRYKEDMRVKREDYERKRTGIRGFVRRDNRKDKQGRWKPKHDALVMTPGMKYATRGTKEYADREAVLQKRMYKANKKLGIAGKVTGNVMLKKEALPWIKDVRRPSLVKKVVSVVPVVGRRFKMTPEEELILDVSLSFVTGLEGMLFPGGGALNKKQQDTLLDFLDLLNIGLPPEWGIHRLIASLRSRRVEITRAFLREVINSHPLPRRTWSPSCNNKDKRLTGYSCGMWKLLHVVTVGVAEQRGGLNLIDSGMLSENSRVFSPIEAADAIRDYIAEFYNCAICKKNFVANYDDCDNNRRCDRLTEDAEDASLADWKELPVWLWEVHNEVSIRVGKEEEKRRSTRLFLKVSFFPKKVDKPQIALIWPNMEECFLCFNEDGTWDEAEVFKHLESVYWPDSELDPRSERLIRYEGDGSRETVYFLWIFMFIILAIVYKTIGVSSPAPLLYRARRMVAKTAPTKKL